MKIKTKMTISTSLMMFLPALVVSITLGYIAVSNGEKGLELQAKNQLLSVRDTTKQSIENTFKTIRAQIITFSNDRMVIDAMKLFPSAYNIYPGQVGLSGQSGKDKLSSMKQDLSDYYNNDFTSEFKNQNLNTTIDTNLILEKLSTEGIAFQHAFLSNNPNPLGEKDLLVELEESTLYKTLHNRFHPHFREYQQQFNYYDIFLVDAKTGNIVYSVFKEIDYATSLNDGAFADSAIANVYQKAVVAEDPGFVAISDYTTYIPSYQNQSSFIASPIFEKENLKGVLIFQIPTHIISTVMTHQANWQEVGLGKSGETFLVGADLLMRSESRQLLESSDAFFNTITELGMSDETLKLMQAKNSSIGLLSINSPGAKAAINGETGFQMFQDYRGTEVLSAYAPVKIQGLNWAVLAQIDQQESFAPVADLKSAIFGFGLGLSIIVLIVGASLGLLIAKIMIRPLENTVSAIRNIAEGEGDLTQRVKVKSNDELGELGSWINRFIEKLQNMIKDLHSVSSDLGGSSLLLSEVSQKTKSGVIEQQTEIDQAASATEEMASSIHEVAANAETAAASALEARNKADESKTIVEENIQSINTLLQTLETANSVVQRLEQDSNDIGGVLDVIRNIAEQTNLLALNAAIEAARAGEQGRGFAVVADEVRTLASRTQESTEEIQKMIERLQSASKETVQAMETTNVQAQKSTEYANSTGKNLVSVTEAINQVSEMNTQIANASEEQKIGSNTINQNVNGISHISERTATEAEQTAEASDSLSKLASQLQHLLGQYKV